MGKTVNSVKSEIDIRRVLKKYLKNWYFFAIALAIAFVFAHNKNRYIVPVYQLSTTVLIEDKSHSQVLQERGSISASPIYLSNKVIDNQIALLKSFAQIKRIIEQLDFEISYFKKGQFVDREIYKDSPFYVVFDDEHWQPRYQKINIRFVSSDEFELWADDFRPFSMPRKFTLGQLVSGESYSFSIHLKDGIQAGQLQGDEYAFIINEINGLTNRYLHKTHVQIEYGTSMIVISTQGENRQKERDYLNMLTEQFLLSNLERKNQILTNTLNFISGQIEGLGEELTDLEIRLEAIRKEHQFMTFREKIAGLLRNIDTESRDLKNHRIELEYYEYLYDYVMTRDDLDDVVMPSSMGYNLPMFNALAGRLSLVIQERDILLENATPQNPYIQSLEKRIATKKASMVESMRSTIETKEQQIRDTEVRLNELNREFSDMPLVEREFLELERQYNIVKNMYDLLMRRKVEVELQRAANMSDHEIVDYAGDRGVTNVSQSPNTAYMHAVIWALLIPSVFLFLVVFLNNRVMALDDITANTDLPMAGSVSEKPAKGFDTILRSPNSYFTQLFRIIRIKLNLQPKENKKVLMVTSAVMGEGKTFFSLNIASVYAMSGKKTLLIDFDFRQSDIAELMNLDASRGITTSLLHNLPAEQFIQGTFTKNLDILLSGPVPPNPDELIESEQTRKMFADLRERYDYIILDTPPIGLFGDAYLLNKYTDAIAFIVRHNFTRKKEMVNGLNDAQSNKLENIHLVYNFNNQVIKDIDRGVYDEEAPGRFFLVRWSLYLRRIVIDLLRKL
jgi:tyrosine-protein kinase Etk/Wzc